jgi:hypothetical protein
MLRVDLDCLAIIGDSMVPVAASLVDDATANIRFNELGADLYGLCVVCNRSVAVTFMQ